MASKRTKVGIIIIFVLIITTLLSFYHPSKLGHLNFETDTNSSTVDASETKKTASQRKRNAFLELKGLQIKDPKVIEYLQEYILVPPSKLPYKLTSDSKKWPSEYTKQLNQMFGEKTDGFFIECGANDGEFLSNTLKLEMKGWKGLLVEAQPELGKSLRTKNRKAWFANVCLSPYQNITEIEFAVGSRMDVRWKNAIGKLLLPDNRSMKLHRPYGKVLCFPLVSVMAAIGVKHVDYFSLDVEGVELKVLKTLPFDETLVIDYIQVETNHLPEGEGALTEFLRTKGYDLWLKYRLDAIYKRRV